MIILLFILILFFIFVYGSNENFEIILNYEWLKNRNELEALPLIDTISECIIHHLKSTNAYDDNFIKYYSNQKEGFTAFKNLLIKHNINSLSYKEFIASDKKYIEIANEFAKIFNTCRSITSTWNMSIRKTDNIKVKGFNKISEYKGGNVINFISKKYNLQTKEMRGSTKHEIMTARFVISQKITYCDFLPVFINYQNGYRIGMEAMTLYELSGGSFYEWSHAFPNPSGVYCFCHQ